MAIFTITAPSGAGKTTIAEFVAKYSNWVEAISHTTRPLRDGEEHGKTYYFVNKGDFFDMAERGEFAESVEYDGNYYGISNKEIERVQKEGSHVYIIVEFEGYKQIKEIYPDSIGIFLYMSKEDCMANMLLRGDSFEKAMSRIEKYKDEISKRNAFQYVIKNVRGKQVQTVNVLRAIISQYD